MPENPKKIRKRIASVKNTQKITGAMKMIAAARLRRAEERARMARPYADRLQSFLDGFAISPENVPHPLAEIRGSIRRSGLIVITSDRGLCGSYNGNVIREAERWLNEHDTDRVQLYVIGKKGVNYFKRRQWKIGRSFLDLDQKLDHREVKQITELVSADFTDGEVDEVNLVYSSYVSPAVCKQVNLPLLPIRSAEKDEEDRGPAADFIYQPSPEAILEILFPKYLYTRIVTSLAESFASEQGQRMVAMTNATENAGEMIKALTLKYNKARQSAITGELLEIVGGAEALEK